MTSVLFVMYIIYFFCKNILMNSGRNISVLKEYEQLRLLVGVDTYYIIDIKNITLIQKESTNYFIYFETNTLELVTGKASPDFQREYQVILNEKRIKLDDGFKDEDMNELKNICLDVNNKSKNANYRQINYISNNEDTKIYGYENTPLSFHKIFTNNVFESIPQWKLIVPFLIIIYITFNYFKVFEVFTDDKFVIIFSYFAINILGYGIAFVLLKKIIKVNKIHKLHFIIETEKLYYLNKDVDIEIEVNAVDMDFIQETLEGYLFVLKNGTRFHVDKRYSKSSINKIYHAIKNKNNSIKYQSMQ